MFFDDLQHEGLHPDYGKQVCGAENCAEMGDLLVQEDHGVCSALGNTPRLVPLSVVAHLQVTPYEAHAMIHAARRSCRTRTQWPPERGPASPAATGV